MINIEAKTDAKARLSEMRALTPVCKARDQIGMRFHAGSQLTLILYLLMVWQSLKFLSYSSTSHGYGGWQGFGKDADL